VGLEYGGSAVPPEFWARHSLDGDYRLQVRILGYRGVADPPCEKVFRTGKGLPYYPCPIADHSLDLDLSHHSCARHLKLGLAAQGKAAVSHAPADPHLPTCGASLETSRGVWIEQAQQAPREQWAHWASQPYTFTPFACELPQWTPADLQTALKGRTTAFRGASTVREVYRAFHEFLNDDARTCFFRYKSTSTQTCAVTKLKYEGSYSHDAPPWTDPDVMRKWFEDPRDKRRPAIIAHRGRDFYYTQGTEGFGAAQMNFTAGEQEALVAYMEENLREIADVGAGRDAGGKKKLKQGQLRPSHVVVATNAAASASSVLPPFQNEVRTARINAMVAEMAERNGFALVDVFGVTIGLLGQSFDGGHLCPMCCGAGKEQYASSEWTLEVMDPPDPVKGALHLMLCRSKVMLLVNAIMHLSSAQTSE